MRVVALRFAWSADEVGRPRRFFRRNSWVEAWARATPAESSTMSARTGPRVFPRLRLFLRLTQEARAAFRGVATLAPLPSSWSRRLAVYRFAPGPSLKSDGTNVCGSAGSVRSACCRGVSGTSGGGRTRARDHAIWETQYL